MENVTKINLFNRFYAKVKSSVYFKNGIRKPIKCVCLENLTPCDDYNITTFSDYIFNENIYINAHDEFLFNNIEDFYRISRSKKGQILDLNINFRCFASKEKSDFVVRQQLTGFHISNVNNKNDSYSYQFFNESIAKKIENNLLNNNDNFDTEYAVFDFNIKNLFEVLSPIGRGIYHILHEAKDEFGYVSKKRLLDLYGNSHLKSINYGLKELELFGFLDKFLTYRLNILDLQK